MTLPISAFVIGTAATTMPAAMLLKKIGRKPGFMLGAFAGMIGALVGLYAIYVRDFPLFILATVLQGCTKPCPAFTLRCCRHGEPCLSPQGDLLGDDRGVAAGLAGTSIVMFTADLLAPATFAGCYAAMVVICALAIVAMSFVDIPPQGGTCCHRCGAPFA